MKVLDYQPLEGLLRQHELQPLADALPELLARGLDIGRYGDILRWQAALSALPAIQPSGVDLSSPVVRVGCADDCTSGQAEQLEQSLKGLHPWRKGPFEIAGVYIDTEWRSDYKWNRLFNSIESLDGKRVLDVGCGSGYHCWRMAGEGAALVVGIDPTPLFIMQYWALQTYMQNSTVWVLPARMEALPTAMKAFDTVFSMGVLYHRRSPFDHLLELREALAEGGELVLETLVIEGEQGQVLLPEGRYSKMGNVWFIPSVPTLCSWLKKVRFKDVEVVDVSVTETTEQRSTEWMTFQSLADFLDPEDANKTIEGYAAPRRAIIKARV